MPDPYADFQKPTGSDPYAEFSGPVSQAIPPTKPSRLTELTDKFINHPLFPKMAEMATGMGITEQNQLYQSLGPEAAKKNLGTKVLHYGASLGAGAGRVFYGMLGMSPADVAVLSGSLASGQPEIAGAWFGARSAQQTPGAMKAAFKNPSPENVESVLTTTAGVVGAAATAGTGKPSATLNKVGELRRSVQPFARKATGVESAVKEEVGRVAEKHGETVIKNTEDRVNTIKGNLRQQREARTEIDRGKIQTAEENRGIEAENKAKQESVAKRGETAKTVDEQSTALGKSIDAVESKVYKAADTKFNDVRGKLGITETNKGPELPPEPLIATVKDVQTNVLRDIPENIKEFRAILNMEGEEAGPLSIGGGGEVSPGEPGYEQVRQAYVDEGLLEENKPLTWDKLQSLKSRLDARLRSRRPMNGDVKRALFQTRDAVVGEMGKIAQQKEGASASWQDARSFWRQMKEDFHEPTGPSGSGSPVAQALDAVDPKNIRQPFLTKQGPTGNRAIDILRKYPQFGGNEAAGLAEQMLKSHETMGGLPKKATDKPLKTNPEVIPLPTDKPIPARPETPTVDVNRVAKEAIATRAKNWGMFNARDIGILSASAIGGALEHILSARGGYELPIAAVTYEGGKYAASRLLNKPAVIDWLSRTPPSEVEVLMKIPGADKLRIVNGLTEVAVEQGKNGRPVSLSTEAKTLLGPANVARIVAASGALAGSQVKNRRDALQLLGK